MDAVDQLFHKTSRRTFLRGGAAALSTGVVSSLLGASTAFGETTPAQNTGRRFYISTSGSDSASGLSSLSAWKSLERVNREKFEAGDAILLRSGDVFHGQLQPQGSGQPNNPIVLGRYGTGRLPIIDMGAALGPAVKLEDQSWWHIHDLEVTSGAPPDPRIGRAGIAVLAATDGKMHNITIRGCFIHDIWGTLMGRGPWDQYHSAAIYVGAAHGTAHMTAYAEQVLVENNRIERVDRCGIIAANCAKGLVIRRNWMDNLGGDAIVPMHCDGVLVERNSVTQSCLRTGNPLIWIPDVPKWMRLGNPHSAAIWLAGCTGGIMQFNQVYDTGRTSGNGDGEGYDIDLDCHKCTLQYNYSNNNHGMLLLMQRTSGNVARYNISQNDQTHILALRPELYDGNLIYNNVFYIDYGTAVIEMRNDERDLKNLSKVGVPLRNNIFYATGDGHFQVTYRYPTLPDPDPGKDRLFFDNCYFGPWVGTGPNDPRRKENSVDPLFVAPGTGGIGLDTLKGYQLRPDSPCIGRGIAIPHNGGRDFWGNPLPDGNLDIGAFQHRPA